MLNVKIDMKVNRYISLLIVILVTFCFNFCSGQSKSESKGIANIPSCDTSQKAFDSIINIQDDVLDLDRETFFCFLPDSVSSKIPKGDDLLLKFKVGLSNFVVLKVNANGHSRGDILLFSFSKSGHLVDYMIIERYNDTLAREIRVLNDTSGFKFRVDEEKLSRPGVMPLFIENEYVKGEKKWYLNPAGKFVLDSK